MSIAPKETMYEFRIHTNLYAGNFERQLCGFITGCHDGSHGPIEAELFIEERGDELQQEFDDIIGWVPDDSSFHHERRVSIIPGETGDFNSLAIFFIQEPTREMIDVMLERLAKFPEYYGTCMNHYQDAKTLIISSQELVLVEVYSRETIVWRPDWTL